VSPEPLAAPPDALSDPEEVLAIILDPDRRQDLYPYYHRLRALAPVHRTEQFAHRRAVVLTRHADVQAALRNPRMQSDSRNVEIFDAGEAGRRFFEMMQRQLLFLSPPEHDRVRALIYRPFTPRAIEARRPRIRQIVDQLLERAAVGRTMDLVADFAYPLPVVVICEMLGVSPEDLPRFYGWAYDFARRGDVSDLTPERIARGEQATRGFTDYFLGLIADRRHHPRDDLMSALVHARDAQGPLSDADLVASCVILLQAGHETTADLIGMGTAALLREPGLWQRLDREPALLPSAVEELLRYDSSVQISQRVSDQEQWVGGVRVAPGEVCVMLAGAANRDPAQFADPDRLDLERSPNPHVSFGFGRHRCLGASLARAEIQVALGALVRRFPRLELATDKPEFRRSLFLRGLARLPVQW
jgi:cytochrome P450